MRAEKVVFVMSDNEWGSECVAVFPTRDNRYSPDCWTCYAHFGQHSGCAIDWAKHQRLATPEEYKPLYDELTNLVGYKLKVMKSFN